MEYLRLLPYHNLNRWIVLLTVVSAVALAWHGLLRQRKWTRSDTLAGLASTTVANVQFVIGLFLYVISPHIKPFFTAIRSSFRNW